MVQIWFIDTGRGNYLSMSVITSFVIFVHRFISFTIGSWIPYITIAWVITSVQVIRLRLVTSINDNWPHITRPSHDKLPLKLFHINCSFLALLKHAPRQQHNALSIFFFQLKELNSKYLSSLGKSECIQELKESSGVAEIDFTIFYF